MNKQMEQADFVSNLLALFDETFHGSPGGEGSIYLDRGISWEASLRNVSAGDASRPVFEGATTIVAQVTHVLYYFEVMPQFMAGASPPTDWPGSWKVTSASNAEWDELRARLLAAGAQMREHFLTAGQWDEDSAGGAMALLVHCAYHLGAVRQLLKALGS
jgi:hypothetical protein